MSEYIKLKSQVTKLADYEQVDISGFLPDFTPDAARLEKDMNRQLTRLGSRQDCDRVAAGDTVVLTCQSENEKFCKKSIAIPVGKGLFSRELEQQLVDLAVGQQITLTVEDCPVTVQIQQATRVVLPVLSQQALDQLRKECIDRQIEDLILDCEESDMASAAVWRYVSENSTYALDEAEVAQTRVEAEEKLAELAASDFSVSDTEEDGDGIELSQMVYDMYLTGLKMGAIGQQLAQEAGQLLTEADYARYVALCIEAHPEMTEAQIRSKYTREEFAKYEYGEQVAELMDQFIDRRFKACLNP